MKQRVAVLVSAGVVGIAAAWLLTRGGLGALRDLVATVRRGTPAPPLVLPEAMRPRTGSVPLPPPARFLPDPPAALEPRELASGLDVVEDLTFTPDGRFLVSAGYGDYTVRVWDVRSGQAVQAVRLHRRPHAVAFSPGGERVLVADVYHNLRSYPWHRSGRLGWSRVRELEDTLGPEIAVSPDGRLLATSSWRSPESGEIVVLSLADSRVLARAALGSGMRRPAFSPSGRWLAAGSSGDTFTLWDLTTGEGRTHLVPRVDPQSDVGSVAFSPDERLLATGHMDSSITIWALDGPRQRHNYFVSQASTLRVAFAPSGSLLATAQQDGAIYFWDPESARLLTTFRGHRGGVREFAWSRDGRRLASYAEDGRILIWGETPSAAPVAAPVAAARGPESALPVPAASGELTDADVVRLLVQVRRMEEIPADQRRALDEAARRLPQMSAEERAVFGLALSMAAAGRELGQALLSGLVEGLGDAFGGAAQAADSTSALDDELLAWNLDRLPEAAPLVAGLRALAAGELPAIERVLTSESRAWVAAQDPAEAIRQLRQRWEELRTRLGPGPLHLAFAGDERSGLLYLTGSAGALSREGIPLGVDLPTVPVVLEDREWRIALVGN